MGQENNLTQKRTTSTGGLPTTTTTTTTNSRNRTLPRGRQIQKTFNNIKITILCGFVTILVLRGTIGVNLGTSQNDAVNAAVIEETNRILAEIRSDSDPSDRNQTETFMSLNETYALGPKILNWDTERTSWLDKNREYPNFVKGKPRILLLTGSPPKPCDNPIGDHYLLKSIKNKIDYCRLHGIEIVYNMAHLDMELAGYWAKLPMIRRLMLSHPEVEWIWWMDSDAFFTDMVFELPMSKYKDYNMVIHGYPDLLFEQNSWIAINTGSFLFRNCQWSLDLLDAWAPMGPKGPIREEAGKILTANLKGRPAFEADDQSALIYLLLSKKDKWMEKVFLENSFYLHGYWAGLVDRYEEMMEKYHPGLGDERWPFVTHFVGCKPCGSYGDYPVERCLSSMERAFNFADNQVLKLYGFRHRGLLSPKIKRIRNETITPLEFVDQFDIRRQHEGTVEPKN
ncbi:putative xyloglucan 6-xylosyltransferase [Medicago truncatula]|uniref:xyloglucan 6-xylosyltransferase n=1 Tax=Medicago truncatula TaxID=3880 RepID=A0A072UV09_MEDTR|nr:probable xyloglucan 6-xylosyltransferase 3 [Medicago truncatula]KEH33442.1 xyloglucan xylosyltransferase [Medicago truncatula]RHN66485.1 putative xyloglucan 6-xylosyltransferase [Medicago truncatula]